LIHLFVGWVISVCLINMDGIDPVVPVLVAETLNVTVTQIRNIVAEDDEPAAEISVAEGDMASAKTRTLLTKNMEMRILKTNDGSRSATNGYNTNHFGTIRLRLF
jgi:hypothetical protein